MKTAEDRSFNDFLKAKLEEDVEVPPVKAVRAASVRPIRFAFAFGTAAALVAAGFFIMPSPGADAGSGDALAAIEFLEEAYGSVGDGSDDETPDLADRLLAWQDAPYDMLFSDAAEL